MVKKNNILLFIFLPSLIYGCASSDLDKALDSDKEGNTTKAIAYLDSYIKENSTGDKIETNDKKINLLQAKRIAKKIEDELNRDPEDITAEDLRRMQKKIRFNQSWDKDDVVFGLIKAQIDERLQKINQDCESLENILNIFLKNGEKNKAYKTYNFIKEKDPLYSISPLTEIKIIDVFVYNNEKKFLRALDEGNYEEIQNFFLLLEDQYFSPEHKKELEDGYKKIVHKKMTPYIKALIEKKYYLSAYTTNKETINDKAFTKEIKNKIKAEILGEDNKIRYKDFLTLEGYLIISPKLKPFVQKEYYDEVDKIKIDDVFASLAIQNRGGEKELVDSLAVYLKNEMKLMTMPVKSRKSNDKKLDYKIELNVYKRKEEKQKVKITITKMKPKVENIIIQDISSIYDEDTERQCIEKLVKKIMRVIRGNIKPDIDTMIKSARYYLKRRDLNKFKKITSQLILINQLDPFCEKYKHTFIKLLSEYERL